MTRWLTIEAAAAVTGSAGVACVVAAVAYGWVYAGKNGHAAGLLGSLGVVLVLVAAGLDEPRRARRRGPG